MKSIIKKSSIQALSMFLSFLMIFYLIPASVFALDNLEEESSDDPQTNITEEETIFELEDRREESVKHFRLDDGSIMAVQYGNAVHRADESGVWQDIDNRLFMGLNDVSTLDARVKFAKKTTGNETLFVLHDGNMKITLSLNGANKKVYGQVTNHSDDADATQLQRMMNLEQLSANILYANILDGVDLEYIVQSNNIKENIIVKERADEYVYNFTLKLNNLTASVDKSGQILLADNNGNVCYTIPAGVMIDANGESSCAVSYTLTALGNGRYTLTITADAEWINADGRAFPVTIDPPIYATSAMSITDITVSKIPLGTPDTLLAVSSQHRSYWKLNNLVQLPKSAYIHQATFHAVASGSDNAYIGAFEVTTNWSASLTWLQMNSTSNPKGKIADRCTDYQRVTDTGAYSWNVTPIVRAWYSGNNYGMAFAPMTSSTIGNLYSSESTGGTAPVLCIQYTDIKGLEDYWSYSQQSAGFAGNGYVNLATGNLVFAIPTLSSLNSLLPISPTLIYDSELANKTYTYQHAETPYATSFTPLGCKLNLQESIVLEEYTDAEGEQAFYHVWADADGTEHYFRDTSTASVYQDEDGLHLRMVYDATEGDITITDTSGTVRHFQPCGTSESKWYLNSITDKCGNKVIISVDTTTYRPTTVALRPSGTQTDIEQLRFGYNSAGKLTIVYNPNSHEAAVVRYADSFLSEIVRAHSDSNVTWDNWQTFANNNTNINGITVDATAVYEHNESGYLTGVRNELSAYEIQYEITNGNVTAVREYAGDSDALATGQSVLISYGTNTTIVRTSGADDTISNADDMLTTYVFDRAGRATSCYTTDSSGTQFYGASSGQYVEDNIYAQNSLKTVVQAQESSPNYLINGDFEAQGNPIPGWTTLDSNGNTFGTYSSEQYNGDASAYLYVRSNGISSRSISQQLQLPAGAYTLSLYYKSTRTSNASLRLIADCEGTAQDAELEIGLHQSDISANYQNASLNFETTSSGTVTIKIELILDANADGMCYVNVDDIMLSATTGAMAFDMTEGGHFEATHNGTAPLSLWTTSGSISVVTDAQPFGSVLKLTNANVTSSSSAKQTVYQASDTLKYDYMLDNINADPGPFYLTVSAWGKSASQIWNENSKFALRIEIWYYKAGTTSKADPVYIEFAKGISDWQFISGGLVTDRSLGLVDHIDVSVVYNGHPGFAYVDDISVTFESENTSYYTYNSLGYVNSYKQGKQQLWYEYNPLNQIEMIASNYGYCINYAYDSYRRLKSEECFTHQGVIVRDDGSFTLADEDGDGFWDVSSRYRTSYNYNTYGLPTSIEYKDVEAAEASSEYYTYYTDMTPYIGATKTYTDTTGGVTRYFYDESTAYLMAVTYPDGTGVTYRYDAIGNLVEVLPAKLVNTGTESAPVYGYDEAESLTNVDYTYDSVTNRLTSIDTPSTRYTFVYDAFGNTTSIVEKELVYNNTNTLASYTYNANNGKLNTMTYGNGFAMQYKYDALDRISEIWYNTGTGSAYELAYTYHYDSFGRLHFIEDHTGGGNNMVNTYDAAGRLRQTHSYDAESGYIDLSTRYTYDDQSKLTLVDYDFAYRTPSGLTSDSYAWYTFEYNSEDQLTRFGTQFGTLLGTVDIVQNNVGRLDEKTYTYEENGVPVFYNKVTYEYTSSNVQINTMTVVRGTSASTASATIEYRFEYDDNGNVTHVYERYPLYDQEDYLLYQYYYDDLGQLIREDNYQIYETYLYTYDAAGNRTAAYKVDYTTDVEIDVSTLWNCFEYQYNGDRFEYTYTYNAVAGYDGIGNLTGYGDYYCNEYTWQGRELVASRDADYYDYSHGDSEEIPIYNEATYTYNANGIRTSKTVNGVKHEYILDGAQIVAETWVENNVEHMMVFLYDDAGSPIGFLYRTSEYARNEYDAYFYEKNFFGDVEKIYNESGECVAQYAYNAWGEHEIWVNTNGIATLNPIRYRGYYYDTHTGLYYLQSRYYNPEWGRFISADCYVATGQGILGNNMYIYCNNNPVMYVDPTGELFGTILTLSVLVSLAVAPAVIMIGSCLEDIKPMSESNELYNSNRHRPDDTMYEKAIWYEVEAENGSSGSCVGGSAGFYEVNYDYWNSTQTKIGAAKANAFIASNITDGVGVSMMADSVYATTSKTFNICGHKLTIGVKGSAGSVGAACVVGPKTEIGVAFVFGLSFIVEWD